MDEFLKAYLANMQSQPKQLSATSKPQYWPVFRGGNKLLIIAATTTTLTQLSRVIPAIIPVTVLFFGSILVGLCLWALLTDGSQSLELALIGMVIVLGFALGIWDAAEVLGLISLRAWLIVGAAVLALFLAVIGDRKRG